MSETLDALGQCLCGDVEIDARGLQTRVGVCHCGMCRNWGGGPFFSIQCEGEISINNKNKVSIFNSSEWAERGFCNHCGTHLFYKLKQISSIFYRQVCLILMKNFILIIRYLLIKNRSFIILKIRRRI